MGWRQIPGAAVPLAPDLWVEVSWLSILIAGMMGWAYGYAWRRAVSEGQFWVILYMILATASLHLVTQGTGDVFFRILICSLPSALVWRIASGWGEFGPVTIRPPHWQQNIPSHVPGGQARRIDGS
jgi:hypothetical protein